MVGEKERERKRSGEGNRQTDRQRWEIITEPEIETDRQRQTERQVNNQPAIQTNRDSILTGLQYESTALPLTLEPKHGSGRNMVKAWFLQHRTHGSQLPASTVRGEMSSCTEFIWWIQPSFSDLCFVEFGIIKFKGRSQGTYIQSFQYSFYFIINIFSYLAMNSFDSIHSNSVSLSLKKSQQRG